MNESKHILVTGGAGYIGSHTVVELIEHGYIPVIVDDFSNSTEQVIEGLKEITKTTIIVHRIDTCDFTKLKAIFELYSFAGVIHFAAFKAVRESIQEPLNYYRNNLSGLINVLDLSKEFEVKNIVFSSSCAVYGNLDGGKVVSEETEPKEATSPYGSTKSFGEQIISDLIKSGVDIKALNLRYFNPIGAHSSTLIGELPLGSPNNLMPIITQSAVGKFGEIKVYGNDYNTVDGTCVRDYVHVVDVANAHVKGLTWLIEQDHALEEHINIGTGKGTSVLEIIETFERISKTKLNWSFAPRRDGDVAEIYADASKAIQVLGWKSNKTVEQAVSDAWDWELKLKHG
ncbi:MAG: UDP-glucose 4-epimerase GalE [Crocinitomicaceae bacterium]|nr:UDP-glucose 4-epimerase GalE [Crocinitomicaceae bacterium]MDG1776274.1 UDP-glucose 4-epimerase GalE [Crocinitomicaceae bacterium]